MEGQFIRLFSGWGRVKAERLMAEIGVAGGRRLKGLGENHAAKLAEAPG